jgi:hypothetical protein
MEPVTATATEAPVQPAMVPAVDAAIGAVAIPAIEPLVGRTTRRTAKQSKPAAEAAEIVAKTPDISGADLGRKLGASERTGPDCSRSSGHPSEAAHYQRCSGEPAGPFVVRPSSCPV